MKRSLVVGLVAWLIAAVIFMAFAAFLMSPWEQEREAVYTLYLPQDTMISTLAEKQELAYRWFHKQNVVEMERANFEEFKAMDLVFYDYDLRVGGLGFNVAYLGVAADGWVYHASTGDGWISPYHISSYTLSGDQLYLRLERSDRWVAFWLGAAAIYGVFPGMVSFNVVRIRSRRSKATIG